MHHSVTCPCLTTVLIWPAITMLFYFAFPCSFPCAVYLNVDLSSDLVIKMNCFCFSALLPLYSTQISTDDFLFFPSAFSIHNSFSFPIPEVYQRHGLQTYFIYFPPSELYKEIFLKTSPEVEKQAHDGGQSGKKLVESYLSFSDLFITNPRNTYIRKWQILTLVLEGNRQGKAELIRAETLFWESSWPRKPQ